MSDDIPIPPPAPTEKAKKKTTTMPKMKGIRERASGSFAIVLELGFDVDPITGTRTRKQKWINFKPTPGLTRAAQRKEAEAERIRLLSALKTHTFVTPSKTTLLAWLREWLKTAVAPRKRPATHRAYQTIVEQHIAKAAIALIPLQQLRASELERYLAGVGVGSVGLHAAVLHAALTRAVRDQLLTTSPADHLEYHRARPVQAAVRVHCWSAIEARRVIETAQEVGGQVAAFLLTALDSGARKSELYGLGWEHVDFETGVLTIERQLDAPTSPPTFGPTKNKQARAFTLGPETLAALRTHRRQQLELRLKNGAHYVDYSLVFAKEEVDQVAPRDRLGHPIQTLSEAAFQRVTKAAGVKRIKFHGVRHTCATLLLQAGVAPHVVAARLGHSTQMLLSTYAHALPDQQQDAAARLAALLHGRTG